MNKMEKEKDEILGSHNFTEKFGKDKNEKIYIIRKKIKP